MLIDLWQEFDENRRPAEIDDESARLASHFFAFGANCALACLNAAETPEEYERIWNDLQAEISEILKDSKIFQYVSLN